MVFEPLPQPETRRIAAAAARALRTTVIRAGARCGSLKPPSKVTRVTGTYGRLSELPLEVEGYELERLERQVSRGFKLVRTVVHLRGGGEEGVGEDVTWY